MQAGRRASARATQKAHASVNCQCPSSFGLGCALTLQKRGRRLYLHVMWKHLEQQSFPLSEEEYQAQLDAGARAGPVWLTRRARGGQVAGRVWVRVRSPGAQPAAPSSFLPLPR